MIKSGYAAVSESTYDGDTVNWNKISAGDIVGWTIEGMGKLPKVGDDFRVGPFIGKCTKVSGSKVYMKVESNSRELNESYSSEKKAIYNWFANDRKRSSGVDKVLAKFRIRYVDDINDMNQREVMNLWDALYDVLYDEQGIDLMNY